MATSDVTRQLPQPEHRVTITVVGDSVDVLDAICVVEGWSPHRSSASGWRQSWSGRGPHQRWFAVFETTGATAGGSPAVD